jgi:hypothetical protein
MREESGGKTDRVLLIEVVLILVLVGMAIVLYWRPAAEGFLSPSWWSWMVLAVLFFTVAWLHTWRRRHRAQRELHRTLDEESRDTWPPPAPPG